MAAGHSGATERVCVCACTTDWPRTACTALHALRVSCLCQLLTVAAGIQPAQLTHLRQSAIFTCQVRSPYTRTLDSEIKLNKLKFGSSFTL